ncbi:hypothetical protein M378DRAFT_157796 [Amanita muscaria Koide BX008]|uniref:Uncharacterized protein n=1 Tax=Amanita muscaria (strain Koide BX008) TaxID=946122 RepID=A0A0C2XI98_AMAMK|nr:hypothetical protein M378DRAFT_157796 [Amanita muscaria Koide BX008]
MFSQAIGLILLTMALPLAGAVDDAVCTDPTQSWVNNSAGQSPCQVAEKVAAVCISSGLTLPQLDPDTSYFGPTASQNNACQCTTVFYSLVSACAACQDRTWINFDLFVQNCTQVWAGSGFASIYNIAIPSYAFLDVASGNTFNKAAAMSVASVFSFPTPNTSIIPKPSTDHDDSSHKGAIIGGVIGGVAFLVAAGVLVWMFRRRRRRSIALPTSRLSKHYIQLSESGAEAPKPAYQPKKHDPFTIDTFPFKE